MRAARWLQAIAAVSVLALAASEAFAGVAGCCRCTGCTSPQAFACRAALDTDSCETTCADLGCTDTEFRPATDCEAVAECYGDCCDNLDGSCSQVPQGSCGSGKQYFAESFCDASNCIAGPPPPTATATASSTATPSATPSATSTATHSATPTVTNTPVDTASATPTATETPPDTPSVTATATDSPTPTETAADTPTETATASPSATATDTPDPTATDTPEPTSTDTPEPTSTDTPEPTATVTDTPEPTATDTPPATPTATATSPDTPTDTPTFTPTSTPLASAFEWIIDNTERTGTVTGIPIGGASFRPSGVRPSLQLVDEDERFCGESGLLPELRLDLPPESCANECFVGIFPPGSPAEVDVASLPRLHRAAGTFDLLITTRIGCVPTAPTTTFRMPNAVTYVACTGDCDGSGATDVSEIMRGIAAALGLAPVSECRANDRSGDGEVTVDELLASVSVLLDGCTEPQPPAP